MMLNIYVMIQGQRVIMNMSPNRIIVTDAFLFVGSDRCEEAVWFCRAVTEEPQARMTMMTGSMSQAKTYARFPAEDHEVDWVSIQAPIKSWNIGLSFPNFSKVIAIIATKMN